MSINESLVTLKKRTPYRTTLKFTADAAPRFEAGLQGSMLRRDDRKRAPLPWVKAQDHTRRGVGENENGAPIVVLSTQTPHNPPDTTTTASRSHTVICPHLGQNTIHSTLHITPGTPTQPRLLT